MPAGLIKYHAPRMLGLDVACDCCMLPRNVCVLQAALDEGQPCQVAANNATCML